MNIFAEIAFFMLAIAVPFVMSIGVSALVVKFFGGK